MCIQQNRQKGNRYLNIWLPFTDYSERELFLKTQPGLLKMHLKKNKPQILGLKGINLHQKIGKMFLGREQRLMLSVWGCTSMWLLLLAVLGLYLSQLRLSVSRALVAGTKPCLRSYSGVWKSERFHCFSKIHWECHHLSLLLFLKGSLEIPNDGCELS